MKSRDVRVWEITSKQLGPKKRSYTVRWKVAIKEFSKSFAGRALADNFRSDLKQAMNKGEAFDVESGLPDSMAPTPESISWLAFVKRYIAMKWPDAAATSRESMTDALATATAVLVRDLPRQPDAAILRQALRQYGLLPADRQGDVPSELAAALKWLDKAALPLTDLIQAGAVRGVLNALALNLDGTAAAATTRRRKRSVFYNVLQYAVELELLDFNPVDKLRVRTNRKKVVDAVDRRSVVSPRQARELLTAVSYVGSRGKDGKRGERLVAFFACLYFAALRPGEALGLRVQGCYLPEAGWGSLTVEKSRPSAGKRYTNSGEVHDERGLKHRGDDEPRTIPIPPELVAIVRAHIERFGAGPTGHLFRSEKNKPVSASTYSRVWRQARELALPPHRAGSPLGARPYDLRHAGVSLWLNAGVAAPDVADRAGHSVDVLLKVYAKCIDGNTEVMNARIELALAA